MARTQAEIGVMVAKIYDRIDKMEGDFEVMDAMLLVEVADHDDLISVEDESGNVEEVPATLVLKETTTHRLVVEAGILDFSKRLLYERAEEEE